VFYIPFVDTVRMLTEFLDGFFDAGILMTALKGSVHEDPAEKASRQKHIGRRLRLAEY
jgi:hypothetical protein